ncbi:VWA domain-containing protein [Methyloligella sp. 2.7D]|uniref:vWA domain-containing protein n=1 Tax=unclassified Methyloligella TaxID=2625955 RepID=UPI00157DEE82|nr:VWA domain-containing protein [Methyloligella sp. GL2]QKP76857.1 VWA domain-containing protein [Methyloligella sp. GL2]
MIRPTRFLPLILYAAFALLPVPAAAQAVPDGVEICTRDAMIVFDASGSMAGSTTQDIYAQTTRLQEVRTALQTVLPNVTRFRKVGLITYGPGPYQQCNVELDLKPIPNATGPIMSVVNGLKAAGKTPLSDAVKEAAEVLHYRTTPGVVVLLTDGEETCGGAPCELGKMLKETGEVTVHVIAYKMKAVQWMGPQSILEVQCLARETNGEYITAETQEDLVRAFEKTLGCPIVSQAGNAASHQR